MKLVNLRFPQLVAVLITLTLVAQPAQLTPVSEIGMIANKAIVATDTAEANMQAGPYVDLLDYSIINQDDQRILKLLADEIDVIGDTVDPSYLDTLSQNENITVVEALRNGYGYFTINCEKYPYNITAFRRAFSFAINKTHVVKEVWDGLAVELDSPVPKTSPYSIEGTLDYNYYDAQVDEANGLLDSAGFLDWDDDGYREAPDGSDFDVLIEVASTSNIAIECGQIAAVAFEMINIDATSQPIDFYDTLNRIYFHNDYDIAFMGKSFLDLDVDWLAYEYWSEYADEPYRNYPNFRNDTYDSWRNQLLESISVEEVQEASSAMQEILVFEAPIVVLYENILLYAHRNDRYEGWEMDALDGISSSWTNSKVRLKEEYNGPVGGTLRVGIPNGIDTMNILSSSSQYSKSILRNLYDSLFRRLPSGEELPWLVSSYEISTNDDDPTVPAGQMKLTFSMPTNHSWSDGTALTAYDVAFTLNYLHSESGNPYGPALSGLTACFAPNNATAILQLDSTSFWDILKIVRIPILPKHIFQYIDWNAYSPNAATIVTSGGFYYNGTDPYLLEANPRYFHFTATSPPDISSPEDAVWFLGQHKMEIKWYTHDLDPRNYSLVIDGNPGSHGSWTESSKTIDFSSLDIGVHNVTVILADRLNQTTSDEVQVTVIDDDDPPVIMASGNLTYVQGSTGNFLNWTIEDPNPSEYVIFKDGLEVFQEPWLETELLVQYLVDGLPPGVYNYTLVAIDGAGNSASNSVTLTVNPGVDILLIVTIGGFAVIVVGLLAIAKSRR
ncbi:MAG: ABC transporter substrate-binding protein [Candidatus Thorarchaeota archaeon]